MAVTNIPRIESRVGPTRAGFHDLKWYYIVQCEDHGLNIRLEKLDA
jgi:hypothetical protein